MRKALIAFSLFFAVGTASQAADFNTGPVDIISCPAKGKSSHVVDLSTGTAPWVVTGPGMPNGKARATPIDEAQIPLGWKARIAGARWVQALPSNNIEPHAPETVDFTLTFQVKKGKRMPRLSLKGQVTADQNFSLDLMEPTAPNQHVASGLSYGDETPGEAEQGDVQYVEITKSGGLNAKPLGHYPGLYILQISVENSAGIAPEVGLLAGLKLGVKCGGK